MGADQIARPASPDEERPVSQDRRVTTTAGARRYSATTGIEELLAMASIDERFAEALAADPDRAATASGVPLSPTERGVLQTIDGERLRQMARSLGRHLPEPHRRVFLARAAAALGLLAGGGLFAGGTGCEDTDHDRLGRAFRRHDLEHESIQTWPPSGSSLRRESVLSLLDKQIGLGEGTITGSRPLSVDPYPRRKKRAKVARVILGQPEVSGALKREIVWRIVRRHSNELKYCYAKQLMRSPELKGRMVVGFTVDGSGAVVAVAVQSSTASDKDLEECAVAAFRRWLFPRPTDRKPVRVTMPLMFLLR